MDSDKQHKNKVHEVTKKLSKLVTNRTILEKQKKRKDGKNSDDDDYKIQDATWKDNADEINNDIEEGEENG